MGRKRLFLRLICLFLLLTGLLYSNTNASPEVSEGALELQVVAGAPEVFNDRSLAGGKYPAGNATVSIYRQDSDFLFEGYTNKQGQLIVRNLPVGLNKYEIVWWDFRGDSWRGEGSISIAKNSLLKKLVELKRETLAM